MPPPNENDDLLVIPAPNEPPAASSSHAQAQPRPIDGSAPPRQRPSAISDDDLNFWKNEIDDVLSRPGETLTSKSPSGARPWATSLFDCFCPADLCLLSFCCPCIVFGRTHHRINKRRDMQGYEPVNTSCLLFVGTGLLGIQWVLEALQRMEMRKKYNLQGSCAGDLARSFCCSCCLMAQLEKESEHRDKMAEVSEQQQVPYAANEDMVYPEVVEAGSLGT